MTATERTNDKVQIEFVGVDGCPAGWFSIGFARNGDYEAMGFFVFADLLAYYREAELVLVDMPIGLPDGPTARECDTAVRKIWAPAGRAFSALRPGIP